MRLRNSLMHPASDDMDQQLRIAYLAAGFLCRTLSAGEHEELDRWVNAAPQNLQIFETLTDPAGADAVQRSFDAIRQAEAQTHRMRLRLDKARRAQQSDPHHKEDGSPASYPKQLQPLKQLRDHPKGSRPLRLPPRLQQALHPKYPQPQHRALSHDPQLSNTLPAIASGDDRKKRGLRRRLLPYIAAATLAGALLICALSQWHRSHINGSDETAAKETAPSPAASPVEIREPFLLLHNGDTLRLSSQGNGLLATGDGSIEQQDNSLYYRHNNKEQPTDTDAWNTLTTPAGTLFRLTLADGTRVWLNAASSLRYPVSFGGSDRTVSLQGEAYFEVAHNSAKPFYVQAGQSTIKVLGTHFNIDAYGDEGTINTTLLEGSVEVSCGSHRRTIQPGQQARSTTAAISIGAADTEEAVAWKNGSFLFRNTAAEALLAQVGRWYGMEVVYRSRPTGHFRASLQRTERLAHLLQVLNTTGNMHITQQGNQLIVDR